MLIALQFLASGSFLQVISDTFLSFDKASVSRVVRCVTKALVNKMDEFIIFQMRAKKNEIKQGLFRIGGFPCAVGCVDGTHIRIKGPSKNEPDFVNGKGFHSINVQAICNHEGEN